MREKKAFHGYQEGVIKFPPTYKFDKGLCYSLFYDIISYYIVQTGGMLYDKLRIPSWCDRILWKSKTVYQTLYDSVSTITLSDHKPVFAYFLASLEVQDQKKLKCVVEEVLRNNDKRENDLVPTVKLFPKEINFGVVKINDTVHTTLELINTGLIPVVFTLKSM